MAHKHNRRRVRPRGRSSRPVGLTFDMFYNVEAPFGSAIPLPSSTSEIFQHQAVIPPSLQTPDPTLSSKQWHNRYVVWQDRGIAQQRVPVKTEAEQIKLFGGEPGDDIGLCYKMLEVFEGMNWINSVD